MADEITIPRGELELILEVLADVLNEADPTEDDYGVFGDRTDFERAAAIHETLAKRLDRPA